MAGSLGHNDIAIFLPAAAQNLNQFFWGQILLLQPIQKVGGRCFLYRSGIEDGSSFLLQQGKVMFQLVDILFSVQAPPVPGNTLPLKVDGDRLGTGFDR